MDEEQSRKMSSGEQNSLRNRVGRMVSGLKRPPRQLKAHVCLHCAGAFVAPSANVCPFCGHNYPLEEYMRYLARGEERGYAPGYAAQKFFECFGEWPSDELRKMAEVRYLPESEDVRRKFYVEQLVIANERGYSTGWAAHRYRDRYGGWPPREFGPG